MIVTCYRCPRKIAFAGRDRIRFARLFGWIVRGGASTARPAGAGMSRLVTRSIAALAASAFCAAAWTVILVTGAHPHDAPSGWTYPVSCCSDFDCREVGDAFTRDATIRVFERPEGYVISSTGETIPMTSKKVRNSPDGRFHWCSVAGKADGKTICLFVPPRGY